MENGKHTYQEITNQAEAWTEALALIHARKTALLGLLSGEYNQVLFTGCGSTYYLSIAASTLFQELTGRQARAVPGGELLFNPQIVLGSGRTLLVAVSRSGETSETVRAVEQFRLRGLGEVIVISNHADKPLAGLADIPLVIEKGQEQSVAQTRSFASMYITAVGLAALAAGKSNLLDAMTTLPAFGQRLLTEYAPLARQVGENLNFDRFYFLGSGIRYGLACEINLKMKEMTLTHSEPFHFLEFRHGPKSMVTPSTVVVGYLSDANRKQEEKVLTEMAALGASVSFHSHIPELVRGVLYLPVLQLMSWYRSMAKGLNPDRPLNLSTVVFLD
jgi:glucosamine--fructose-6-phosphate aminotransferase (isomerizing)